MTALARRLGRLWASACILLLAGCSGLPKPTYDFEEGFDFSRVRNYAWTSRDQQIDLDEADLEKLDRRIRRAVDEALGSRGMSEVERADAEILVAYSIGLEDRVAHFEDLPRRRGGSYGPWDYEYQVGTLVLWMIEPATEGILWAGRLQSEVSRGSPSAKVEAAVERVLEEFPPGT